jgi:hypothetical protein
MKRHAQKKGTFYFSPIFGDQIWGLRLYSGENPALSPGKSGKEIRAECSIFQPGGCLTEGDERRKN